MKFYHCFHTSLPDQFVEANAARLIKWVDGWKDENRYFRRQMIVDNVDVRVNGSGSDRWPTLISASSRMVDLWLQKKGNNFHGGYWETLAEDQRDPYRVTRGTGPADDDTFTIRPGQVHTFQGAGAPPFLTLADYARLCGLRPGRILSWDLADERPKPPLKREGILAGEIVGYRCWRIEKGWLRSVYQSDVWKPGCILEGRELGDWDSRGIHAWKDPSSPQYHDYIRGYLNSEDNPFVIGNRKPAMVTGTVFLWGDVVEHERGWRAEYARVRSLDWLYPDETMMGREPAALEEFRALYGALEQRRA